MGKNNGSLNIPYLYEDQALLKAALEFTSRNTGFRIDLIEKDFFCSVILQYLYSSFKEHKDQLDDHLIFKGGTCLNKVHVGFYRLSEDLDFSIPIDSNAKRSERNKKIEPIKEITGKIGKLLPGVKISNPIKGANESRQYNLELEYQSVFGQSGKIKLEFGLREVLIEGFVIGKAATLLQNPFSGDSFVPNIHVNCLSQLEAYAEKLRAALTRRAPAIRDYFDIDHAANLLNFDFKKDRFLNIVAKKLSVPGAGPVYKPIDQKPLLLAQLDTELRPVLRDSDFYKFDLDRAIQLINEARLLIPMKKS